MSRWKSSLALKITAIVLFAISLVVFGLSSIGALFGYEFEIYSGTSLSYFETQDCWSRAERYSFEIFAQYVYESLPLEALESDYSGVFSNVHYTLGVVENDEVTVLSNTIEDEYHYGFKETFNHVDSDNNADKMYQVTIAIQDPMPIRGGTLYYASLLYETVKDLGSALIIAVVASFLVGVAAFVLLCCMAGHRRGSDHIELNWMDRLPLDLYAAAAGLAVAVLITLSLETFYNLDLFSNTLGMLGILVASLIALAWVLSLVTRIKVGKWWRNTLICRILLWFKRNGIRCARLAVRALRAIPMVWRSLLVTGGLLILLLILGVSSAFGAGATLLLYFLLSLLIVVAVCFGSLQLQKLQAAGKLLAEGDFDTKVDTTRMYWDFKRHGEYLNSIGDGMSIAVEQKMRSERLKTELITNVSHDIKTPLTSIINYVDLLQKPHSPEEEQQYLEVLQRQSARLKKLTEDLLEASKASTGNVTANLAPTNVLETLNQALGEYQERLEAGNLTVVTSYPTKPVSVLADGRLLWRILDNLLNNICKYALSGTRVYITVQHVPEGVQIAVKNISRQQLNVTADELMERFVRGDAARSTEGSGLGLNIAKSLAELQQGKLRLAVDGDLFKAELILQRVQ